jgi:hypothetical protein
MPEIISLNAEPRPRAGPPGAAGAFLGSSTAAIRSRC